MEYDVKQLDAFTVKASPIKQYGDTLSYIVSSFAGGEDRSIEDVLRRMPGIEIQENGKILYQGLPLQKFYVEGLDLMSGRYTVVSKNLPHATVGAVEILENHQPLQILQDRAFSPQASLNLKLKRAITATGTANLGLGASPLLWEANITPMVFTKKFQLVASYQSNNIGNDISAQLNQMTLNELINNADRPNAQPDFLGIQSARLPEIDKKRYLNNQVHLFNVNGLLRLKKDFQLRSNLYYVNDFQQQDAMEKRMVYTPLDTLSYTEEMNNKAYTNFLMGEFTLSRNIKQNYLSNELKIQSRWDKQQGLVYTETEEVQQALKNPFQSVSNDLRFIQAVGKQLFDFQSFLSYDNSPHRLEVSPGQFAAVLNNNEAYDKILQRLNLSRFYTDNSMGFSYAWKRLQFSHKVGFAFRKQLLESSIVLTQQGGENTAGLDFTNSSQAKQAKAYVNTEIEYKKKKWVINALFPLSWQRAQVSGLLTSRGQELARFWFNPKLSANYKISNFWSLRGVWEYKHTMGDIEGIYYAYILRSYRSLTKNAAPLSERSRFNFLGSLRYKNPISSVFGSLAYVYSITDNNLIYSSQIQTDGTSLIQAIELPNTRYSHIFNGRASKYFTQAKSTLSIQVVYNHTRGKSLINETLFNSTTQLYSLRPGMNVRIRPWLNSEYELNASSIQTFIEQSERSTISMLRHTFKVFAFPTKNQLFSLSTEYYRLQGANHYFADFSYRYTFTKKKVDLEFRWSNIFNAKSYTTYQNNGSIVYQSSYFLRPSQVYLSFKFRL